MLKKFQILGESLNYLKYNILNNLNDCINIEGLNVYKNMDSCYILTFEEKAIIDLKKLKLDLWEKHGLSLSLVFYDQNLLNINIEDVLNLYLNCENKFKLLEELSEIIDDLFKIPLVILKHKKPIIIGIEVQLYHFKKLMLNYLLRINK